MNTSLQKENSNNLFRYATSELSQDAFISWLLSFAMEENWNLDSQLRECALVFLRKILNEKKINLQNEIRVTRIEQQYKNIDVLVVLNETYYIIIEDKTFTDSHDDQINRYRNTLIDEKISTENIICVYYKIIEQPHRENNVDCEFTRKELLDIFKVYKSFTDNTIFKDYVEHLEYIDYCTKSFNHLEIKAWTNDSYRGFFVDLIENGIILPDEEPGWGYVSNPSGGFMGLWWHPKYHSNHIKTLADNLYLQIEKNKICVILKCDDKENERDNVILLKTEVVEKCKTHFGNMFIKTASRFATHMTLGHIVYTKNDYADLISEIRIVFLSIMNSYANN